MGRPVITLLTVIGFAGTGLLAATDSGLSWSDGVAGMSGSIPLHLRKCSPGLNSHTLAGLVSNVEYAFQVVGKFGSGTPSEDAGDVLRFRTGTGGAATEKDDQLVTMGAALLTEKSVTLMGGYSAGVKRGDELTQFRFVYVNGDRTATSDLRRVAGAVQVGPRWPMSTVVSTTLSGLPEGGLFTFQVIGERPGPNGWEILGAPKTFVVGVPIDDNVETSPALPGEDAARSWVLQSLTASKYKDGRKFSSLEFYYNLGSRVPSGAQDLRGTPNVLKIVKSDPASGFKYCKVEPSGCGGCHGQWEDMRIQRNTEQPVIDRISAEIWLNGRADNWQYTPGGLHRLDIYVKTNRPPGEFNHAGFNLNVSGGTLIPFDNDDTVRLTGGNFSHAGTKNPSPDYQVCHPQTRECRPYGASIDNESASAGELTNTAKGSEVPLINGRYQWSVKWRAPPRAYPNGVDLTLAFMVASGDGSDNGTYERGTNQHSDQIHWDWWSFIIPRRIICEVGTNQRLCVDQVMAFTRPPSPPPNTETPGEDRPGLGDNLTPVPSSYALVAVLGALFLRRRRRSAP